jgi:hypothetical protein
MHGPRCNLRAAPRRFVVGLRTMVAASGPVCLQAYATRVRENPSDAGTVQWPNGVAT